MESSGMSILYLPLYIYAHFQFRLYQERNPHSDENERKMNKLKHRLKAPISEY